MSAIVVSFGNQAGQARALTPNEEASIFYCGTVVLPDGGEFSSARAYDLVSAFLKAPDEATYQVAALLATDAEPSKNVIDIARKYGDDPHAIERLLEGINYRGEPCDMDRQTHVFFHNCFSFGTDKSLQEMFRPIIEQWQQRAIEVVRRPVNIVNLEVLADEPTRADKGVPFATHGGGFPLTIDPRLSEHFGGRSPEETARIISDRCMARQNRGPAPGQG